MLMLFFFFFQAEDGIRDLYVTGVQTCALPILLLGLKGQLSELELHTIRARMTAGLLNKARRGELALTLPMGLIRRSEERRVGKECRSRWRAYHQQKKNS